MDGIPDQVDALLRSGARRLTGYQRRLFQAEVAAELCGGNPRLAERRYGVLPNSLMVILGCAQRMTWKGRHPIVKRLGGEYPGGVRVAAAEMKSYEARLERSITLPKYDVTIKPRPREHPVKSFLPDAFAGCGTAAKCDTF